MAESGGAAAASTTLTTSEYCVDLVQLAGCLRHTQPEAAEALALSEDGPTRRAFLTRLQSEVIERGTMDVLRNGIKHGALRLDLFYGTPSAHNRQAQDRFKQNRFTVTRQLRYHQLDVVRRLLADAGEHGAGRRYLIQHSAGSGKSNSIAWLAHQLIGLTRDDAPVFDSIIVVTDRVILDRSYSMKQAIQEGFILDVLAHYTPVASYYRLAKTMEDDLEFDPRGAQKKLRRYVEGSDHAISLKAEIMVDHFHDQVLAQNKIGGAARAMVVTNGIERAVQYYLAIRDYLQERKSRYQALVAFSGEHELGGAKVTEASLDGLPSARIAERFTEDPYRFLVCADKFQTGYDEPLLHTMYVDKTLSGIKAVQTLSRLNRAHPKKHDVFVVDFLNDADTIREAFADYYRATILADETDPNKLHDLQADLDRAQVYAGEQVEELVRRYLGGEDRDRLDPILDACVAVYRSELDEDGQVEFKGKAKGFIRTYSFLSSILTYSNAEWEKRSIFLNFLVPKLPAPEKPDLSKGILDAIDLDSYRVEKQVMQRIMLLDEDAEIDPVPGGGGRRRRRAGAGPALQHPAHVQRAFRRHPVGGRRPRAAAHHRDHSRACPGGHGLPHTPSLGSAMTAPPWDACR